jgi:hypothetical protein
MAFVVLVVGWIVLGLLGFKVLYSLCNFIYCVKLSAALGHSLDLRRYGPWAGKFELTYSPIYSLIEVISTLTETDTNLYKITQW